ncbi:EAL and HDOD domain-containing protein [Musicola paradisiaca]|uniref:Diguanylate phosphodiesterase n=3 Tax=Musicola paradisiaca TaxID=69223 RepID=C6C7L9_MUSP7|nr:EAL domain-containing protein [Musicola paradisiaca]ACS85961.1 diguanylate phosphodiesterase [Musicola paradisiaca Ech703]
MYSFVARQPIFDRHLNTVAYEIFFRNGLTNAFPNVSSEYATAQIISDQFLCAAPSHLVGHYSAFVNFPYQLIVNGVAHALPRSKVVIEVLEQATPDDDLLKAVRKLHDDGFRIALDDFSLDSAWDRFIPYIHIIKFDVQNTEFSDIDRYLSKQGKKMNHVTLLAEKIESHVDFERYKKYGFDLFQGYFFSKPEVIKNRRLSQNEIATFQLVKAVSDEEIDFKKVEMLIKGDVSLSYKVMRYAKNILYRTVGASNFKCLSLKDIAMYLGKNELRRFVAIACLSAAGDIEVEELYQVSLTRGRFCELAAEKMGCQSSMPDAFLCGLFSLLDVILDLPLKDIFRHITLSEAVARALLQHEGKLYALLRLSQLYEQGLWEGVGEMAKSMQLSERSVITAMDSATRWADEFSI